MKTLLLGLLFVLAWLNDAIAFDPTKDIVASAFKDDDNLTDNQYSGMLVYSTKKRMVQT